ncbi:putative phage-related chromosomal island protein [Streptococcus pneumoniae]|nr:putative phage-related chromosomal island protein [Streptococcus pneumoniae]CTL87981.1 putative phage-related chromosomal island protein [Streptococcus pneumoniae]CTM26331.1 putative phage-related chromosomal island protein [Streptococcus pneumoniae]
MKGDDMIEDFLIDLDNIQLEDMEIDFNMDIDIDLNIDFDLDGLDLTLLQELEA